MSKLPVFKSKLYVWKGFECKNVIFTRDKIYPTEPRPNFEGSDWIRQDDGGFVLATVYPMMRLANSSPDKEADRHNDGKPEMSYILQGPKGLAGLAQVLEFGSRKYDRGNWLKGFPDTSLIDSMMRHLTAYISGEVLDPESGLPHIDHIHANAKFLAEHGDRDEK
tara:strand:+ start:14825 stop:15319 length:495 start_codon:yes stop_codon:yes gene_type:complete